MRNFLLACCFVAATASTAAAKDEFDQLVADLVAKPDAAAAYFKSCEQLVTPAGQVRKPCTLALADLVGAQTGVTLAVKANKPQHFPKSQLWWREATVEAKAGKKVIATFRVIEVVGGEGPGGAGMIAAHWARVVPDKDATAAAKAGKLPAVAIAHQIVASKKPPKKDHDQEANDRAQATETVQQQLSGTGADSDLKDMIASWVEDSGAIVFGTGPKQRYAGKKGAATMKKWKLMLVPSNKVSVDGDGWVAWGTTTMTMTPEKAGSTPVPYVVFAVFVSRLTEGGGSFITEPALLSFAVAQ